MRIRQCKQSIVLNHHKTSISLEPEILRHLKNIAKARNQSFFSLVEEIDYDRSYGPQEHLTKNLSSACRLFVIRHYVTLAAERVDSPAIVPHAKMETVDAD